MGNTTIIETTKSRATRPDQWYHIANKFISSLESLIIISLLIVNNVPRLAPVLITDHSIIIIIRNNNNNKIKSRSNWLVLAFERLHFYFDCFFLSFFSLCTINCFTRRTDQIQSIYWGDERESGMCISSLFLLFSREHSTYNLIAYFFASSSCGFLFFCAMCAREYA